MDIPALWPAPEVEDAPRRRVRRTTADDRRAKWKRIQKRRNRKGYR